MTDMDNNLPKIGRDKARAYYSQIIKKCSSQGSWKDKGDALRRVLDEFLNELCIYNGLPGGKSRYQERINRLYRSDSEEHGYMMKLAGKLSQSHHNMQSIFTEEEFNYCVKLLCEHIAKSSDVPYPDALALILKPVLRNIKSVSRPVIILKELYTSLDQVKHAQLFYEYYKNMVERKEYDGFENTKFDLIGYTVNQVLTDIYKDKKECAYISDGKDSKKIIEMQALERAIETIKRRHSDGRKDKKVKTPFFIWIFYDLYFDKDDKIVKEINDVISDCNVSFYPIVVKGKDADILRIYVNDLFPECKRVAIQNHPDLPGNLFKSILTAISKSNIKTVKSDSK